MITKQKISKIIIIVLLIIIIIITEYIYSNNRKKRDDLKQINYEFKNDICEIFNSDFILSATNIKISSIQSQENKIDDNYYINGCIYFIGNDTNINSGEYIGILTSNVITFTSQDALKSSIVEKLGGSITTNPDIKLNHYIVKYKLLDYPIISIYLFINPNETLVLDWRNNKNNNKNVTESDLVRLTEEIVNKINNSK